MSYSRTHSSNHPTQFPHSDGHISVDYFLSCISIIFFVFVDSPLSMMLPSFCGVGVELSWAGNTSNMLRYLSSQEQYTLYSSRSPLSPTVEMSLAVHNCRAKGKLSCLVVKWYGTHTNCCPGADGLFSTLKCFNCFLPHNLWVILTS